MVIQNNIPGLNSKRIYNKNSSKLAKSLEKLSSGYSINRAADDSAGLAVSEKMRSQICGMKQSVKNCQDGISLIQTFEGALGETVAIIKRMKSLADQSANGTYDDSVDRNAVEIEYLHLCDEVNHIAETDFNGLVMLNGKGSADNAEKLERAVNSVINNRLNSISSVSAYSDVSQTASVFTAVKAAAFAAPRAGGTACGDFTVYGDSSDFSFDTASGVLTILGGNVTVEGTGAPTTNTIVVAKDKSANVTLRNVNIDVSGTEGACAFKIEDDSKGNVTVTLEGNNVLKSGKECAGLQKNGNNGLLTINGNGKLWACGGTARSGVMVGGAGIGGGARNSSTNITINGGIVEAWGGNDSAGIGGGAGGNGSNITINGGIVQAEGGHGDGSTGIFDGAGIGGGELGEGTHIIINGGEVQAIGGADAAGIGGGRGKAGSEITISGGKVYARGYLGGAGIGGGAGGDGVGIIISGGIVIAEAKSGYWVSGEDRQHIGGAGIGGGGWLRTGATPIGDVTIKNKDTIVLAQGAKDAEGSGVDAEDIGSGTNRKSSAVKIDNILTLEYYNHYNGNGLTEDEIGWNAGWMGNITNGVIVHYKYDSTNPPNTDPDPPDKPNPPNIPDTPNEPNVLEKLIVSIPNAFGNATAKLTYTDNLTLQVGARTKDAVNFTFSYSSNGIGGLAADLNCTAKGLGIDTLTLKTQESANYAIDKLDHALNKVSMIRATFGAAQNRLEHKIDSLNNTTENLTAAESLIRDTDMAKEMMNFTKNQILMQSSQSMLAQANSLPQQVMSLISS